MGRIFRELLIVGCFLWCIALLCPMDRAFLGRRLIVSAGFLIVSVGSLIVLGRGIRGREGVMILSNKNTVFLLLSGQGMRIERIERILRIFLSLVVVCEFWANLANGGQGMRIWRIERILRIFLSLVMVCEFWANGNE